LPAGSAAPGFASAGRATPCGFGPYDYYAPGYYPSYGWNPGGVPAAPGYAAGYQAGAADAAACLQRFRSYDPVSRSYIGRDRQRHPCP
jgi:hypothetical protein